MTAHPSSNIRTIIGHAWLDSHCTIGVVLLRNERGQEYGYIGSCSAEADEDEALQQLCEGENRVSREFVLNTISNFGQWETARFTTLPVEFVYPMLLKDYKELRTELEAMANESHEIKLQYEHIKKQNSVMKAQTIMYKQKLQDAKSTGVVASEDYGKDEHIVELRMILKDCNAANLKMKDELWEMRKVVKELEEKLKAIS